MKLMAALEYWTEKEAGKHYNVCATRIKMQKIRRIPYEIQKNAHHEAAIRSMTVRHTCLRDGC